MRFCFYVFAIFLLISCNGNKQNEENTIQTTFNPDSESSPATENLKTELQEFALNFKPKSSHSLDSIPAAMIKKFRRIRVIDKQAHRKLITLIFAKIYAEHLRCCHQSYVIASRHRGDFASNNSSMVDEFIYMSNYLDKNNPPEYWTSAIIDKYLKENEYLLNYKPIARQKKVIDSITEKINNYNYWDVPIADAFDFPVGKPDADGYYNAQKFQENNHLGDDWNAVTGGNTDLGNPIYSIANGYVKYADDYGGGWGNVIRIVHKLPDGKKLESLYAHCDTILVKEGEWIDKGSKIGTIGTAHGQYLAHLHFELRDNLALPVGGGYSENTSGYLDPTKFILENR